MSMNQKVNNLRVARAIDKVNPKPKMGSKRTAISNKLKMSAIKAETKRREQKRIHTQSW